LTWLLWSKATGAFTIHIRKFSTSSTQLHSVRIMEAWYELQRLEDENFWNNLTAEKMKFLEAVIKPLLRTVSDVDFKAMRFEKDIVEL
jgi:type I restriction enzyme, R subunit